MSEPRTSTLLVVFVVLMALLAATIAVARIHLGPWNFIAAAAIATVKAVVIVLYFMHVKYSPRLIWLVAGAGFFWFGILVSLTLTDYLTRGWTDFSAR